MGDSFLDKAGGYTPVPDKLVRDYGFEVAYVWGKVWRYCQMANGSCTASHETIANRAGMSRRTLIEKLNVLIRDGYIEDLTPGLKNKPHTYCTRIGEDKITSTMQISHTDIDMRILHSEDVEFAQPEPSTMQNLHSQDAEFAQPTMQNLHLKKDSLDTLKDTKTTSKEVGASPPPAEKVSIPRRSRPQEIPAARIFVEVTGKYVLNNTQIREIDERIGRDPPALEKWRETVKAWQLAGNKINGIKGMLDWFRDGIPVYNKQNGAMNNGTHQRSDKRGIKAFEETGESAKGERTVDKNTREYVYPDGHRETVPPVPRVRRPGILPP